MNTIIKKIYFITLFAISSLTAQSRIEGTYNSETYFFETTNENYTIGRVEKGYAFVRKNEYYGVIDSTGNFITKLIYQNFYGFKNGLAKVQKNEKFGFINQKGKEIIPCTYDDAKDFKSGFAIVSKNEKFGFIDTKGKEICPLIYDAVTDFSEEMAKVSKNKKFGFVNTKGKEVCPLIYDGATSFTGGMATVKIEDAGGKYYTESFINKLCQKSSEQKIYTNPEKKAVFNGGDAGFTEFLQSNIKYPLMAKQSEIQGRCIVEVILGADGTVKKAVIKKDIGGGCGKEALRVVKSMPAWQPARNSGKSVESIITLPISFILQ